MTGSFLYVKPTNPEGTPGTAYSGSAPCYAFDIASWEWLLERVLRRQLLPLALSVSDPEHYREVLACREDQYRMHRWTYPPHILNSVLLDSDADTESGLYPFSAFLAPRMKTDSDVLRYDVRPLLPVSWSAAESGPACDRVSTGFGPRTLAGLAQSSLATHGYFIDTLLQMYDYGAESPDFLPPDWSPSDMDAWDQTAESTETTAGTGQVENEAMSWKWHSTVERTEFENPGTPVFKCLTHMRVDDPATTVALTDDSGATVSLEVPPTPYAFRRDTSEYGSVREERGTQVRVDDRATAYSTASVRYALTIPYITRDVDFGPAASYAAFDRTGKTGGDMYVGYLAKPPEVADKMPVVGNGGSAVPDVDWDGKPTWWHANGFPKGLESTLSEDLREQLSALLSVYQPAVPPFYVPLADAAFPKPGKTRAWPYTADGIMTYYTPSRHLAQAVTPFDMSARMDAMTTTVHPVPYLYAKFTSKATRTETNVHEYTKTGRKPATRTSTTTYTYTHTGATLNPITDTAGLISPSSVCSMSETARALSETRTRNSGATFGDGSSEYRQDTYDYHLTVTTAACSSLTCLRTRPTSESEQFVGHKTETRYIHQTTSSDADPTSTDRTDVSGSEPSYDLEPKWLMFPEWVLPWIESADLYAAVESRIRYVKAPAYTRERHTTTENYDNGTHTHTGAGNGKGEITHKSRMRMVSLGTMDLSTGKFPELDVAKLLSEDVDPDPEALTEFFPKSELTDIGNLWNASRRVTTTDSATSIPKPTGIRTRTASYFVVVRWKFDQLNPPSMGDSSFKDLFKEFNAADTALEAKKLDIARLESGLRLAKSRLDDAEAALERALERRDYPESAEYSQTQEAERALEEAKAGLLDAQAALANAQAGMDAAQEALQGATEAYTAAARASEREVADAQAEYSQAVDAAKTGYDAAKAAYDAATGTAKDALDAAQEDYDTAVGAAWDAVEAAGQAMDSAEDAMREAVNGALAGYDSAVANAQADLEAAQADPDATQADLDAAQTAYDSAVEAAQAAMDAAIADAEAEYESAMADARAAYDAAVADYETARDSAQADLDAAQTAYDSAVESAQGDLDTAKSEYDAAVEAAQTTLDEATTAADGRLSEADGVLADATTAHANARAAWKEASYAEADARALVDEAQARLDALKAELKEDDRQAAVEKAQAAVYAAQGLVDELKEALDSAKAELPDLEARLESAKDALRQAGATGVA